MASLKNKLFFDLIIFSTIFLNKVFAQNMVMDQYQLNNAIQRQLNNYQYSPFNPANQTKAQINALTNRIRYLQEELENQSTNKDPFLEYHENKIKELNRYASTHNLSSAAVGGIISEIHEHKEAIEEYTRNVLENQRLKNEILKRQMEQFEKVQNENNNTVQKESSYNTKYEELQNQDNSNKDYSSKSDSNISNQSKSDNLSFSYTYFPTTSSPATEIVLTGTDKVYSECSNSIVTLKIITDKDIKYISGFYLEKNNYLYTSLEPISNGHILKSISIITKKGYNPQIKGILGNSKNLEIVLLETEPNNSCLLSKNPVSGEEVVTICDNKYSKYALTTGNIKKSSSEKIEFNAKTEISNIGGPLLSMEGKVVGIITNKKGRNCALPISFIKEIKMHKKPILMSDFISSNSRKPKVVNNIETEPTVVNEPLTEDKTLSKQNNIEEIFNAFKKNEYTQCYELGKKSNNELSDNLLFNHIMAFCAYTTSKYYETFPYCEKAIKLSNLKNDKNTTSKMYLIMGMSYRHLSNHDNAISNLEKALEYKPEEEILSQIYIGLGTTYEELQKYFKAKYYYTKALNHTKDKDTRQCIEAQISKLNKKKN